MLVSISLMFRILISSFVLQVSSGQVISFSSRRHMLNGYSIRSISLTFPFKISRYVWMSTASEREDLGCRKYLDLYLFMRPAWLFYIFHEYTKSFFLCLPNLPTGRQAKKEAKKFHRSPTPSRLPLHPPCLHAGVVTARRRGERSQPIRIYHTHLGSRQL